MIDASDTAAGAVLQQLVDETWQPLGFFSQKFSPSQKKYSVFGRELTAMQLAVKYFRHLLEGIDFTIYTDHRPLTYALNSNSNHLPHEERYLQYISSFTKDIRHISGKDNSAADDLYRFDAIVAPSTVDYELLSKAQQDDPELQKLLADRTSSMNLQ